VVGASAARVLTNPWGRAGQLWLRPYTHTSDNNLEAACVLLLLYGYFVSVLPGSSVARDVSVVVLEAAVIVYGVRRWLVQRLQRAGSEDDPIETHSTASTEQGTPFVELSGSEA
jgi:hypothetical protein